VSMGRCPRHSFCPTFTSISTLSRKQEIVSETQEFELADAWLNFCYVLRAA